MQSAHLPRHLRRYTATPVPALRLLGAALVILAVCLGMGARPMVGQAAPTASERRAPLHGAMPLGFYLEQNLGQVPGQVRYIVHAGDQVLLLTAAGGVEMRAGQSLLRLTPRGGAAHPPSVVTDREPGIVNYLIGADPHRWITDVPIFGRVTYRNVYPGIDLTFHGRDSQLEYDWAVQPGADPTRIELSVSGGSRPQAAANGALRFSGVPVVQTRPVLYQRVAGGRRLVVGGYVSAGRGLLHLRVGGYDHRRPLIIDPVIQSAQYVGGSGPDSLSGVQVDARGNIFVAGSTSSANLPIRHPEQRSSSGRSDMFVQERRANGALVYSTYIGGNGDDNGSDLALDRAGNAYIAGTTDSKDFPTLPRLGVALPGTNSAVVVALRPSGNALRYSAVYPLGAETFASAVAVDGHSNAYVAIVNRPHLGGATAAVLARISHAGPRGTGTTFVTTGLPKLSFATGIALTPQGNAVVAGFTADPSFVTHNAAQPVFAGGANYGFVTEFGPSLHTVTFSTYLGGAQADEVGAVATDRNGNVYVAGATGSPNFPSNLTFDLLGTQSPFVTRFSTAGKVLYSTILGTPAITFPNAIVVSPQGYATIGGNTLGSWPVMLNPLTGQGTFHGKGDGFLATLGGAGQQVLFSSYLGGAGEDSVDGLALGGSGNLLVCGATSSPDFPHTGGKSLTAAAAPDGFLVKIGNR